MKLFTRKHFVVFFFLFFAMMAHSQITFTLSTADGGYSITCTNPTVQVSASSNYTDAPVLYTWTGPQFPSGQTSSSVAITSPGIYTVVANSGNQSSSPQTFAVVQNTMAPTVNVSPSSPAITCNQPSVVLQASSNTPSVTYQWLFFSAQPGSSLTVNTPGLYTVQVTNPINGCKSSSVKFVGDNRLYPVIYSSSDVILDCTSSMPAVLSTTVFFNLTNLTYSWTTPPNAVISGNTTGTLTTNMPGTYQVSVTNNANGCTSSTVIGVSFCVGIEEGNKEKAMSVFPNPVNDQLFFKSDFLFKDRGTVSVISVLGERVLLLDSVDLNEGIDVSELSRAVYFVELQGVGKVFRIVKE
jgi:hypothetical protein